MSWLDEMEARDPAYRGACEEGTTMTASTDYEARAEEAYAANAREEMIRVSAQPGPVRLTDAELAARVERILGGLLPALSQDQAEVLAEAARRLRAGS